MPPAGEHAALLVDLLLSAAALPDSVREDADVLGLPDREAVSVAVSKVQTGQLYLRRACPLRRPSLSYTAGSVTSQEHLLSLLADVRAQLVENLGFEDDEPSDADCSTSSTGTKSRAGRWP